MKWRLTSMKSVGGSKGRLAATGARGGVLTRMARMRTRAVRPHRVPHSRPDCSHALESAPNACMHRTLIGYNVLPQVCTVQRTSCTVARWRALARTQGQRAALQKPPKVYEHVFCMRCDNVYFHQCACRSSMLKAAAEIMHCRTRCGDAVAKYDKRGLMISGTLCGELMW